MARITFQFRLVASIGSVIVLAQCMAFAAWIELRSIDEHAEALAVDIDRAHQVAAWAGHTQLNLERALMIARSAQLPAITGPLQPRMKETSTVISDLQKRIEAAADESMRAQLADVARLRKQYVGIRKTLLERPAGEDITAEVDRDMAPAAQAYQDAIQRLEKHVEATSTARAQALQALIDQSRHILAGLAAAVLLIGIGLGWTCQRYVRRTLGGDPAEVQRVAEAVAQGRLRQQITLDPNDRSSLLSSMKRMSERLTVLVGEVRQSADAVANASMQIADGNQDLSSRTAQQASALEATRTTIATLGNRVTQSAQSATGADHNAREASNAANQGGAVVGQFVSTMEAIHDSSSRIADIIGVIDGIAFQTNILALNAAVEAARAGEQGRGFAVVASEVRNLAQRCSTAASEIKTLIHTSVERVEQGNTLAASAGATIGHVIESIRKVTDVVGEVHHHGTEQARSTSDIERAMQQLDDLTRSNSSLVEEAAAAAAHLQSQAQQLVRTVAVFETA